jgi:hypothetical protein
VPPRVHAHRRIPAVRPRASPSQLALPEAMEQRREHEGGDGGSSAGGGDRLPLCDHEDCAETETKIAASFFIGRVVGYGFLLRG